MACRCPDCVGGRAELQLVTTLAGARCHGRSFDLTDCGWISPLVIPKVRKLILLSLCCFFFFYSLARFRTALSLSWKRCCSGRVRCFVMCTISVLGVLSCSRWVMMFLSALCIQGGFVLDWLLDEPDAAHARSSSDRSVAQMFESACVTGPPPLPSRSISRIAVSKSRYTSIIFRFFKKKKLG